MADRINGKDVIETKLDTVDTVVDETNGYLEAGGDVYDAIITDAAGANIAIDIIAAKAAIDAIQTDLGDFSAQTNLQSLLAALGIPDVAAKPLYTCLVTDRLDNAGFGLSALNTDLDAIIVGTITNATGADVATDVVAAKVVIDETNGYLEAGGAVYDAVITDAAGANVAADIIAAKTVIDETNGYLESGGAVYDAVITDATGANIAADIITIDTVVDGIVTDVGDPSGHTLTSLTAKIGDIARSLDLILGARWDSSGDLGTDVATLLGAGKEMIAATTIDLQQVAGSYDLFTGTAQHVVLESILIRLPNVDCSDDAALTSISIHTDDTTNQVFVTTVQGAVANLTAEAQLYWTGASMIDVGAKIQLTIAGGAADAATVCDVVAVYRPVVAGGTLA